jgi:hypothetical protein
MIALGIIGIVILILISIVGGHLQEGQEGQNRRLKENKQFNNLTVNLED